MVGRRTLSNSSIHLTVMTQKLRQTRKPLRYHPSSSHLTSRHPSSSSSSSWSNTSIYTTANNAIINFHHHPPIDCNQQKHVLHDDRQTYQPSSAPRPQILISHNLDPRCTLPRSVVAQAQLSSARQPSQRNTEQSHRDQACCTTLVSRQIPSEEGGYGYLRLTAL
ncbi:hypothetical protein BDV96DRAFT_52036 [Lophiotrema nucula]|uniref:Uncharacterized protein n=1 Tax=Lophiotrema nucula TaxID=690887 RepID=A0A6A5ZDH8_9PLEO|nr:hypothetical protein BDV96DRAFT_52036 [Lophiotrema nucula]